jgi:hypothetical protein
MTAPKPWEMAATAGEERAPDCGCIGESELAGWADFNRASIAGGNGPLCPRCMHVAELCAPRPGSPEYRAALRAVETKAYRWLLARLGLR